MPLHPWLRFLLLVVLSGTGLAGSSGDSLRAVQEAARDWARTRAEAVREETQWRWEKEFLVATMNAQTDRVRKLEEARDFLAATSTRVRATSAELVDRNEAAFELLDSAARRIDRMVDEMMAARPYLPPRLSTSLEYLFRTLDDPSVGMSDRFQALAAIFNRSSQFNNSITYAEELLSIVPGEGPRFVSVIYWGLSHAFALDSAEGTAFVGRPGEGGWTWEARKEIAGAVSTLMRIYHDEAPPGLLELPVRLSDPEGLAGESGANP